VGLASKQVAPRRPGVKTDFDKQTRSKRRKQQKQILPPIAFRHPLFLVLLGQDQSLLLEYFLLGARVDQWTKKNLFQENINGENQKTKEIERSNKSHKEQTHKPCTYCTGVSARKRTTETLKQFHPQNCCVS
jgi:hypothetical protein